MSSKKNKKTLLPDLRFPTFNNAEGWALNAFDSLYNFKPTNSLSRDKLNYESGSVKNIHYGDIHTKFSTLFDVTCEDVPFINVADEPQNIKEDSYCVEGDMVFADASEDIDDVGKSIEIVRLHGQKVLSGLHTILTRQKDRKLTVGFGGHLFQSNGIRTQIQKESQGTKVLGISAGRLSGIRICYPQNKKEQKKIVDCLSSLDEVIRAQGKKVEVLREYKKALMQSLFPRAGQYTPDIRFPEFRDAGKWDERLVGEVFKVTRGEVLAMPLVQDGWSHEAPYPVYSSQTKNRGLAGYYSKYLYEDAITWTTDGANAGNVNFRGGRFYCTNVCGVLISDDGQANLCVAELINRVSRQHVSFVGNPKLMNGVMAKIAVPFPSLEEQRRISNLLSSLDEVITAQGKKLDALKEHKKGLMQQLFPTLENMGKW